MPIKIVPKNKPKKFKDLSSGQPTVSSVRTGRTTSGIAWTSPTDSIYKMKKDGTKVDYLMQSHDKQWSKKKLARAKSGIDFKDTVSYGKKDQTHKNVTNPKYKKRQLKIEGPDGKYYNTGGKVSKNWSSCGANIITGRD